MTAPATSRVPGTPGLLRTINDRAALELLLDVGPLTRSQIGDRTGVSRPTASQIVARLEQSGLIEPTGSVQGARGPQATQYAARTDVVVGLALDVVPGGVRASVVDALGRTLGETTVAAGPERSAAAARAGGASCGDGDGRRGSGEVGGARHCSSFEDAAAPRSASSTDGPRGDDERPGVAGATGTCGFAGCFRMLLQPYRGRRGLSRPVSTGRADGSCRCGGGPDGIASEDEPRGDAMGTKRRWKDLTKGQRIAVGVVGAAQVTLTAAAYRDLVRRPAEQVNGTKLAWGLALLVNWVGPIAYFLDGRKS